MSSSTQPPSTLVKISYVILISYALITILFGVVFTILKVPEGVYILSTSIIGLIITLVAILKQNEVAEALIVLNFVFEVIARFSKKDYIGSFMTLILFIFSVILFRYLLSLPKVKKSALNLIGRK